MVEGTRGDCAWAQARVAVRRVFDIMGEGAVGEARIDEAWCKEQRKAVAMEEEEWLARFDDEDITSAESEEDDAFYPQH